MMTIAAFFGSRRRQTRSFLSNDTWIAPATTSRLESLYGEGSDGGVSPQISTGPIGISIVSYLPGHSGTFGGNVGWSALNSDVSSWQAAINAGGSGTVYRGQTTQGASSYSLSSFAQAYSNAVPSSCTASYTGGWAFGGDVATSGDAYLTWSYYGAPTDGTASTAFGYTFAGGVGGPATGVTYNNVTVTPGASYSIVVPTGGEVIIVWFE